MIKKIEKIIPLGIPVKTELWGIGTAIFLAVIRSLFYFNSFIGYYNGLFDYHNGKKRLLPQEE